MFDHPLVGCCPTCHPHRYFLQAEEQAAPAIDADSFSSQADICDKNKKLSLLVAFWQCNSFCFRHGQSFLFGFGPFTFRKCRMLDAIEDVISHSPWANGFLLMTFDSHFSNLWSLKHDIHIHSVCAPMWRAQLKSKPSQSCSWCKVDARACHEFSFAVLHWLTTGSPVHVRVKSLTMLPVCPLHWQKQWKDICAMSLFGMK